MSNFRHRTVSLLKRGAISGDRIRSFIERVKHIDEEIEPKARSAYQIKVMELAAIEPGELIVNLPNLLGHQILVQSFIS